MPLRGRIERPQQRTPAPEPAPPLGVAPALLGFAGLAYALVSAAGGLAMTALAWRVWREETSSEPARQLFAFSILYLSVLFAALLAESGLGVGRI